jgi:hypothetical protein
VRKKLLFTSMVFVAFTSVGYALVAVAWSYLRYDQVKTGRGWRGRVHQPDDMLGYSAVPTSEGYHVMPCVQDIPMRYDRHGFRVPIWSGDAVSHQRPWVLTLGCSFTYGDACLAEDTYPFMVAESIGGAALNAGKCSYGITHLVLLSRRYVPEFKPDVVLVQYSSWLRRRFLLPSRLGKTPGPYFYEMSDGSLDIAPPAFVRGTFPDVDRYRDTPVGLVEFFDFTLRVGLPTLVSDHARLAALGFGIVSGAIPRPCRDLDRVAEDAYREIRDICTRAGSSMLIVVIQNSHDPPEVPADLLALGVPVVRADLALVDRLATPTPSAYAQEYQHWGCDPPRVIDVHPNPRAHRVIADTIVEALAQIPSAENPEDQIEKTPSRSATAVSRRFR